MNKNEYKPTVAFHPGEYIKELIDDMDVSQTEFAKRLGVTDRVLSSLVNGKSRLTTEVASKIAAMTGTSISVWMGLQQAYDEFCLQDKLDTQFLEDETILSYLDYNFFEKLGLVEKARAKKDKILELRKCFKVSSLNIFSEKDIFVNCRKPSEKESDQKQTVCINAWVQTAINIGKEIDTKSFSPSLLKSYLKEIRNMTTQDPALFTTRLQEILSECGVALVILPHLKNARINGAVKWLSNDKAVLAINVYGAFADKFWFTLFHELKHILQHKTKDTFLNYTSSETLTELDAHLEKEADDFAQSELLPHKAYETFKATGMFSAEAVLRFSDQIDIHPGIVVGRLQHDKLIEYSHLNGLKVKYQIIDNN